jgi:hypothetical protein
MASDNIFYSEPYKSNFQFGKQHIIESYCELHDVEYDKSMTPKLYTTHHKDSVKEWLTKNEIGKYIMIQFSGGQPQAWVLMLIINTQILIQIETINHS